MTTNQPITFGVRPSYITILLTAKAMATQLMSFLVSARRFRYSMIVEFIFLTVDILDELNMTGAENIVDITKPNAT